MAVLLLSFIALQTASVMPHGHDSAHNHSCPICHASHSPAVVAITAAPVARRAS